MFYNLQSSGRSQGRSKFDLKEFRSTEDAIHLGKNPCLSGLNLKDLGRVPVSGSSSSLVS